ncbi:hypothetical protein Hdeb2414_s0008g00291111 [Helianthus debilis subsp. tardiflorus]
MVLIVGGHLLQFLILLWKLLIKLLLWTLMALKWNMGLVKSLLIDLNKKRKSTEGVSYESSGRSKKGKQTFNAYLMEVGEDIRKVANMLLEKNNQSNDIHACMEKLETLGWEEFDAKHQTALLLFGESADLRKVWLELKPHTCEMWVKNAGAKYGLF